MVDHQFCPAFFSGIAEFSSLPKGSLAHLCCSHTAASRRWNQITISNRSDTYDNQYPAVINENIVRFSLFALSQWERDVENCWNVTRCHVKVLHCVHESSRLTQVLRGHLLKRSYQQKTVPFSVSWDERSYFRPPGSGWASIEDDHINWRSCPSTYHEAKVFT